MTRDSRLMVLLDTNVLLYTLTEASPFHGPARALYRQVIEGTLQACISPQVLCEFLSTCTDARRFHPALSVEQALRECLVFWEAHTLKKIFPSSTTFERATALIRRHRISRQEVFDAFLAATMLENGVRTIYTANTKDFLPFRELQVVNPFEPSSSARK